MIDLRKDIIPYFRELTDKQINKLLLITKEYKCTTGDKVFLQGEFCQNLIIINSGNFLVREKDGDKVVTEKVILEGDFFDFESIVEKSVTSKSLEALDDSSFIAIDIMGLKSINKKDPVLVSLIKLQLPDDYKKLWDENILKKKKAVKELSIRIYKSLIWSVIKVLPFYILLFPILLFISSKFDVIDRSRTYSIFFLTYFIIQSIVYFLSRLSRIDVDRELIVKHIFTITNFSKVNTTIPIDKVVSIKTNYGNRALRLLKIGEIAIESASEKLVLKGIYKPDVKVKSINEFKHKIINVDRAIELSSFKYLMSKQNGLFTIENTMERGDETLFSFRKSILSLIVKIVPIVLTFSALSVLLYKLFLDYRVLYIDVPVFLTIWWISVDWFNDRYAFEGDKIIDIEKKPLFGKEQRIVADLSAIQSVKKDQKNFIQVLFNYGDIEITTIGGNIIYPSINNPDKVIDNLYLMKKYYQFKEENRKRLERQEEFLNYTKYYQELTNND